MTKKKDDGGDRKAGEGADYGKPPRGRPFEKGKSGNPRGRPRKPPPPEGPAEALRRALGQEIAATIGGRTRKMMIVEALAQQAAKSAASGDYTPITKLARLDKTLHKPKAAEELEQEDAESRRRLVIYVDQIGIAEFLEEIGLVKPDRFGRPTLVARSLPRLFSHSFDRAKRDEMIERYLRNVTYRSEADFIRPNDPPKRKAKT